MMKIHAITGPLSKARHQRCCECDLLFVLPPLNGNQAAYCPRCNAKVVHGRDWSMTRLTAMAVAMLLLMPFAFSEPLISIRLLGTRIDASLLEGIWQMSRQGDPLTASMVAFCTLGAPLTLALSLLYLRFGHAFGMNLRPVLLMLERLKEWVMLDIYLIGMAVAAIKVKEYADIQAGSALIAYLSLTLLSILTLIHVNLEQLWERYYPQEQPEGPPAALHVCLSCHFTGYPDERGRCPRCHIPMCHRQPYSLQKPGGVDCGDDLADPGQPAADFNRLRQRRTVGRHHFLRGSVAGDLRQRADRRYRFYRQRAGPLHQSHSADHPAVQHTLQDLAQPEDTHSSATAGHLDRSLVHARSVRYRLNDVAGESRPTVIFYYGAGSLLLWFCGHFNYSCRRVAG